MWSAGKGKNASANRKWFDKSYELVYFKHNEPSNTFLKGLYLENVGVEVSFVLGQALVHACHLGQRVPESCILRLQLVKQQRELCFTALSLEGKPGSYKGQQEDTEY